MKPHTVIPTTMEEMLAAATACRLQLWATGFSPVAVDGKRPVAAGWQRKKYVTEDEIQLWAKLYPQATNTGILTRSTPSLDIDVLDDQGATAVEALVRDRFAERGRILVRFGRAPKRAIVFRANRPFKKMLVKLIAPRGAASQQLEFLGEGQQIVARGVHPDTQRPYSWHGGRPGGVRWVELPAIEQKAAEELIDDAAAVLVRDHGYRLGEIVKRRTTAGFGHHPHVDWSSMALRNVGEGARNDICTRLAGHLLRRDVDADVAQTLLHAWNMACCVPSLPADDIDTIINSICGAELRRRGKSHG
jgi:hypothetical protein